LSPGKKRASETWTEGDTVPWGYYKSEEVKSVWKKIFFEWEKLRCEGEEGREIIQIPAVVPRGGEDFVWVTIYLGEKGEGKPFVHRDRKKAYLNMTGQRKMEMLMGGAATRQTSREERLRRLWGENLQGLPP